MAVRSTARWASVISHRGRRRGPTSYPAMAMASLMGMGLTSMKRASIKSIYSIWVLAAPAKSPARHLWLMSTTTSGTMLAATEMTPLAPRLIIGTT